MFVHTFRPQIACNDLLYYKSLPVALKTTEGTIVSEILLCICLYMVRKYQASRDKLGYVKKLIGTLLLSLNYIVY